MRHPPPPHAKPCFSAESRRMPRHCGTVTRTCTVNPAHQLGTIGQPLLVNRSESELLVNRSESELETMDQTQNIEAAVLVFGCGVKMG